MNCLKIINKRDKFSEFKYIRFKLSDNLITMNEIIRQNNNNRLNFQTI